MKKYSKRVLIPAILLAATTTVNANECIFNGFYAGAGVGGSFLSAHEFTNTTATVSTGTGVGATSASVPFSSNRSLRKNSVMGSLYLGYGSVWDPVYLGLEASLKFSHGKMRNNDTAQGVVAPAGVTTTVTLTKTTQTKFRPVEFALDIRPGVFITKGTLLYARVGAAWNRFRAFTSTNVTTTTPSLAIAPQNQTLVQHARKRAGLRLGLGLEQEICENWVVRGDYVYTHFRKLNLHPNTLTATAAGVTATINSISRIKPVNHAVMLGITYYWK